MNYHKPNYRDLTDEQLDAYALEGKPLDSMGHGLKLIPDDDAIVSEHYELIVIDTKGMGNHGVVYLKGKTPHGKRLVYQGKIARLVRSGCPEEIAPICATAQYGMEEPVWGLAEKLLDPIAKGVKIDPRGHAEFAHQSGIHGYDCSFPRVLAAIGIANRAVANR